MTKSRFIMSIKVNKEILIIWAIFVLALIPRFFGYHF